MLRVNSLTGFGGKIKLPTEVSYIANTGNTSPGGATNFTFSSVSFGAEDPERYICITAGWERGGGLFAKINSGTIGGVTATVAATSDSNGGAGMMIAKVPTGTTGTVTLVMSGGINNSLAIGTFRILNITSATPVASAQQGQPAVVTDTLNVSVNTQPNDIIIATAGNRVQTVTHTWTGVTEAYEYTNATASASAGSFKAITAETPRTVSVLFSATDTEIGAACAVFR